MIEQETGYQNMYDLMCFSLGMTEKKDSERKKERHVFHACISARLISVF